MVTTIGMGKGIAYASAMQKRHQFATLAIAIAIAFVPTTLGAKGSPPNEDGSSGGSSYYVDAVINNIEEVYAGARFSLFITLTSTAASPSVVNVAPLVPSTNPPGCLVDSFSVTGPEIAQSEYLLMPRGTTDEFVQQFGAFTRDGVLDELIPSDEIFIDIKGHTQEGTVGVCQLGVSIIEKLPQGVPTPPHHFLESFDVSLEPPFPILMGTLSGRGGQTEQDRVDIDLAAPLGEAVVTSVTSNPRVAFKGLATWDDGMDYKDFGRFFLVVDGTNVEQQQIAEGGPGPVNVAKELALTAGVNGEFVAHLACYHGQYVDGGGGWDDVKDEEYQCVKVNATKVETMPANAAYFVALLEADPLAMSKYDQMGYVLLPDEEPGHYFFIDRANYGSLKRAAGR